MKSNLIVLAEKTPLEDVKPHVRKRVISETPTTSVVEYFWEQGHETPGDHAHNWDTTNYVVAGQFEIELQGHTAKLGPGDGYFVPAGVPRTMRAIQQGSYLLIIDRATKSE